MYVFSNYIFTKIILDNKIQLLPILFKTDMNFLIFINPLFFPPVFIFLENIVTEFTVTGFHFSDSDISPLILCFELLLENKSIDKNIIWNAIHEM